MKNRLREAAFNAWSRGIDHSAKADALTNDLLMDIAGKKYDIYEQDDDPIYTIIGNLTNSERRRFIKGVEHIIGGRS